MPELPLTGGCNCGAVRYEVTEPLLYASYCHCTRCQRRSGAAASPQGRPAPGSFHFTQGEDRLKAWKPADGWEKWFCGECGSSMIARDRNNPDVIVIRMGTFDRDPGVEFQFRQFVNYAAPWEPIPDDGLRRYPESKHAAAE